MSNILNTLAFHNISNWAILLPETVGKQWNILFCKHLSPFVMDMNLCRSVHFELLLGHLDSCTYSDDSFAFSDIFQIMKACWWNRNATFPIIGFMCVSKDRAEHRGKERYSAKLYPAHRNARWRWYLFLNVLVCCFLHEVVKSTHILLSYYLHTLLRCININITSKWLPNP